MAGVCDYLAALWQLPCYDCWEEFPDRVHPHTLAAIYAGLGGAVLVAVAGAGRLTGAEDDLPLRRGDTLLVPYAAGPLLLEGPIEVIRLSAPA